MSAAPRVDPSTRTELDDLTLARARRGERAASTLFVQFYQRRVFATLSRIVGPAVSSAEVEELAQESFLRALRALPKFDPAGAARVSTWLLTIATRVALNAKTRRAPDTTPLDEAPEPGTRPFARVDARRTLERAAQSLTPEQRAVFVLRDLQGFTETETAHALDIEVAAAKSRLTRARARLRRALRQEQS